MGAPRVVSCSSDGAVCIWDPSPVLRSFAEGKLSSAEFSASDEDVCVAKLVEGRLGRSARDSSISVDDNRVFAPDRVYEKSGFRWKIQLWTRRPRRSTDNSVAEGHTFSYDHRLMFSYSTSNSIEICLVAISKDGEIAQHCEALSGIVWAWRVSDGTLLYTFNLFRTRLYSEEADDESESAKSVKDEGGDEIWSILLSGNAAFLFAGTASGRIHVFDTRLQMVVGCMHFENGIKWNYKFCVCVFDGACRLLHRQHICSLLMAEGRSRVEVSKLKAVRLCTEYLAVQVRASKK